MVVLPNTNLQEAKRAIERIRQIFSTQNGFPFPISFSYGISKIRDPEEIEKILSHADQEMYTQKRQENQSF